MLKKLVKKPSSTRVSGNIHEPSITENRLKWNINSVVHNKAIEKVFVHVYVDI